MIRILVSLVFCLSMLACGGSEMGEDTATRSKKVAALTGDSARGQTVYDAKCKICHKADGKGDASAGYPDLQVPTTNNSVADIARQVIDGNGSMPGFGAELTNQEIADTVAYLKATFK